MEKKPDEPEDVTNKPLPSMSEPMEVQDAVASTLATPFAHPIIAASKSKAQKQREYRQRITASRTPAQAAAARKSKNERQRKNRLRQAANFATPFAEPITAAPKTRAQIQREYRQRIAASKTPAQAAAAREARNVRYRNNRLRQAANLVIASGSLEATTTSSSRSGQRLNTVHIDTQRQFTDQQRQTLATEPAETTVQPSTSSDQIEVQAQSTWNTKWSSSIIRFKSTFLDNDFGYAKDLKPITAAQLKETTEPNMSPTVITDLNTDLTIKEELETLNEETLEIKTETHEEHITDDNPFKNIQLEVKDEFMLTFEKESTDSQSDEESHSQFVNENKYIEEKFTINTDLQGVDDKFAIKRHLEDVDNKFTSNSNLESIKDEVKEEDSVVSFDYPNFDDTRSMDSDDVAALSHVEACLQDDINIKHENYGFENNPKEEFPNIEVKNESDYVTETHLISNKLIQTTSTVTHPQDGLIESQTTKTLVMEILNVSGKEDLSKMNNPEEILPTQSTNYGNSDMEYDDFQLNSITGNILTLEQEAYGLLTAKKKKHEPGKKIHECLKCPKTYSQKRELLRHLRVHETIENRAQGVIKGQKTRMENRNKKIQEELEEELKKKEKAKKGGYECTCGEVFLRRSRMETCLRSHNMCSVTNLYPCMTCKRQFKDKEELALHRKRLHRKRFPCKFCPTNYNTRKELFKHLQVHQKVQLMEYKVISEVVKGKQKLKCFMCSKTCSEIQDLKSHVMEDHKEPYSCPRCKLTFPKIIDFGNHTKTYHPEVAGQDVLDVLEAFSMLVQAWKCEECGLQFHEADKLALHQIEKHSPDLKGEHQFQCTDCRRVFISQKGLTSHRRVHHSTENVEDTVAIEPGVMCLECRKMCKDMIALTSHMRFHSPERKYPCKFCDFRFATPEKRKAHAEIHTGDMKFVCFICEYQCSSENRLKQHKSSLKHLNMKEYLLTGKPLVEEEQSTSKQGKIKDTLRKKEWGAKKRKKEKDRKETEKEEDIEVACDICGDMFSSESVMLEHKQTHPFIEFPNDDKPSRIFFK